MPASDPSSDNTTAHVEVSFPDQSSSRLPFVVGVLSDLSGDSDRKSNPRGLRFVRVNLDNFNDVMRSFGPSLSLTVKQDSESSLVEAYDLQFESLDGFGPATIVRSNPLTQRMHAIRSALHETITKLNREQRVEACTGSDTVESELAIAIAKLRSNGEAEAGSFGALWDEVVRGIGDVDCLSRDLALARIAIDAIDCWLRAQIDAVMNHPRFKELEARWRSVYELVLAQRDCGNVWIRVLNLSFDDLAADLHDGFGKSALYRRLDEEWSVPGAVPFGVLIGDYLFDVRQEEHVELLRQLGKMSLHFLVPFLSGVRPESFGLEAFEELSRPRDLARIFEAPQYLPWTAFRSEEASRYLALCLPGLRMRRPAAMSLTRIGSLEFCSANERESLSLVGHAAFGLTLTLIRSFERTSWFADCEGREQGVFGDRERSGYGKGEQEFAATETVITATRAREIHDCGFVPIMQEVGRGLPFLWSTPLVEKARTIEGLASQGGPVRISLESLLSSCRFAHVAKLFLQAQPEASWPDLEQTVGRWLASHVAADGRPISERCPLLAAECRLRSQDGEEPTLRLWIQPGYRSSNGTECYFELTRKTSR